MVRGIFVFVVVHFPKFY